MKNSTVHSGTADPNHDVCRPSILGSPQLFEFSKDRGNRYTHYLFRYPAKFHPPVVRRLVEQYTEPGDWILDPFCGSGSLLVEAAVQQRNSIGSDIDPVAVFVSQMKTHRFRLGHLRRSAHELLNQLEQHQRSEGEYERRKFVDLSESEYASTLREKDLSPPAIPNLLHWFRRYVVVDLALILAAISNANIPGTHQQFFRLCFAAILRASSNADPVPVSGLEVTSHMRKKDAAGRLINPFRLFSQRVANSLESLSEFLDALPPNVQTIAFQSDAASIARRVRRQVDAVITSPPYHNAVDYYRRHQLEMFWLGFTRSQGERQALIPYYIGKPQVASRDPRVIHGWIRSRSGQHWERRIRADSPRRADAFKHYMVSMQNAIDQIARILRPGRPAVLVLGNSTWRDEQIPTAELLADVAQEYFYTDAHLYYPIKNRYMSYQRHNGADISTEHVLVLRRNQ